MDVEWELSQSFQSDGEGIRAACVLSSLNSDVDGFRIVTGNQGGRLCSYGVPSGEIQLISFQHDHAVTALLSNYNNNNTNNQSEENNNNDKHDAGNNEQEEIYATGCKDSIVRIFRGKDHALLTSLKGHEKPVTSLAWSTSPSLSTDYLISGSWDGTAKVWDLERNALVATLPEHENSVSVAGLPPSSSSNAADSSEVVLRIATGSAGVAQGNVVVNTTVRIWQVSPATGSVQQLHSVVGDHEGPVRDVCCSYFDGSWLLASCSNDGTVRLRNSDTAQSQNVLSFVPDERKQQQQPPMLLCCRPVGGSGSGQQHDALVASAEDGHVIIWSSSSSGENGRDGGGSSSSSRTQIILHVDSVWNVLALPNGDFATSCQDGQVRIFTRATDRMATAEEKRTFQDGVSSALSKQRKGPSSEEIAKLPRWEHHEQTPGRSEGQVQVFQKNGVAIAAQWSAASGTWIEVGQVMGSADGGDGESNTVDGVRYDHVFPIEVDSAPQGGGTVRALRIGYNDGENTFVAAQRFIDAHMLPQYHLNEIADYIQQRAGHQTPTLGGGASGGIAATTGVPIAAFEYMPLKAYKPFELPEKTAQATLDKMKTKLREFEILTPQQDALLVTLAETLGARNRYHASTVSGDELQVISTMLREQENEPSRAFPFLDLARLVALHADATSSTRCEYWKGVLQQAVVLNKRASSASSDGPPLEGPAAVAIPMLSLRLFANSFKGGPGSRGAVASMLEDVLDCTEPFCLSSNKNVRLSAATVLCNAALFVHSSNDNPSAVVVPKIVPMVNTIVSAKTYESEALLRAMQALGTLLLAPQRSCKQIAKDAANNLFLASKVEPAAMGHTPQVKTAAKEIYALLQ